MIGLLNKAIPIIALQLNAFAMDDKLLINVARVLDVVEEGEDEPGEAVDQKYWENRASKKSMELLYALVESIKKASLDVRMKYNRGHVALVTTGNNFCWLNPRKGAHIHFKVRPGSEAREAFLSRLEDKGIECSLMKTEFLRINLNWKEFEENQNLIQEIILKSEETCKR